MVFITVNALNKICINININDKFTRKYALYVASENLYLFTLSVLRFLFFFFLNFLWISSDYYCNPHQQNHTHRWLVVETDPMRFVELPKCYFPIGVLFQTLSIFSF